MAKARGVVAKKDELVVGSVETIEAEVKTIEAPSQALVPIGSQLAMQPSRPTAEMVIQRAEEQIRVRKGLLTLIAHNADPSDVVVYGRGENETVHFAKAACRQILSWMGVDLIPTGPLVEKRYDGPDGPYIDFEAHAVLVMPDGRRVGVMGNRATYDDFFAKRTRYLCPKEGCGADTAWTNGKQRCPQHGEVFAEKRDSYLPLEEVDIPSVKQAAITNMWNHALEDAGFKPSLRELKEAGMDIGQLKRVEFGGKRETEKTKATAKPAPKHAPKPAAAAKSEKPAPEKLPGDVGVGFVSKVVSATSSKGTKFRRIEQNGHTIYCYDNRELDHIGWAGRLFDLLDSEMRDNSEDGFYAEFKIQTEPDESKGCRCETPGWHHVKGALRIGKREWLADGTPVVRRDEQLFPETAEPEEFQATDADIPF